MNREIKFRAWNSKFKKMYSHEDVIESDYIYDTCLLQHVTPTQEKGYENYIFLQYTGLKDKNGVEIFEGDILQKKVNADGVVSEMIGEVIFSEGAFCLKTSNGVYGFGHMENNKLRKEVVIGNIYQNQELLK